jgi:hypothetical protein
MTKRKTNKENKQQPRKTNTKEKQQEDSITRNANVLIKTKSVD